MCPDGGLPSLRIPRAPGGTIQDFCCLNAALGQLVSFSSILQPSEALLCAQKGGQTYRQPQCPAGQQSQDEVRQKAVGARGWREGQL